jgi:hypothetical protein
MKILLTPEDRFGLLPFFPWALLALAAWQALPSRG